MTNRDAYRQESWAEVEGFCRMKVYNGSFHFIPVPEVWCSDHDEVTSPAVK